MPLIQLNLRKRTKGPFTTRIITVGINIAFIISMKLYNDKKMEE